MKNIGLSSILIFLFSIFFSFNPSCKALNFKDSQNVLERDDKFKKAQELKDNLPDSVKNDLDKFNINPTNPEGIEQFSIKNFFNFLFSKILETAKKPLSILANCLAIILLAALFTSLKPSLANSSGLSDIFNVLSAICTCGIIITPIVSVISSVSEIIKGLGKFMLCFGPVFSGIIAMTGNVKSSIGYSSTVFILAQVISSIITELLLPFTGAFLALSVGSSINGSFNISSLTSSIKKIIIFILSLLTSLFVGIFTIQNTISSSIDGVGIKTAKFFSKNFIPIVGGALSEALSSIVGSLSLIKSAVGGFGILACILTLVPPILMVIFFMVIMALSLGLAKSLGIKTMANTITSVKDCLSILLAFLICYGILIISTTSLMITMSTR